MKVAPLCDVPSAAAFAFSWLDDALRPASEYGERVYANVRPFAPGQEAAAQTRARRIAEIAHTVDRERLDAAHDLLRGVPDAAGAIARASLGDTLSDPDFLELLRFGDAVERIDQLLAGGPQMEPPASAVAAMLGILQPGRAGKHGFYLSDAFDPELAHARSKLQATQAEYDAVAGREVERVTVELGRDDLGGDEFVVMREDRRGPLPAGVRVLRETPTYLLCALARSPETLAALTRRDAAAEAVATAEEVVRERLSAFVRERSGELDASASALGEFDVLVAAARFASEHDCHPAEIVPAPELAFEGGRFLPMTLELQRQGRSFVPIDLELHDTAVLTGPNMGGKSVCLRTCGFIALCAAFGLPVPAVRARASLFGEIAWLGIGSDDAELGGLLSSFAKEVVRVRDVLARNRGRLLVLLDEFARTTTPAEAKALLVALLERLRERNARGLAATHLAGVAKSAGVRHFAVRGLRGIAQLPAADDLPHALARLADSMDYSVVEVRDDADAQADALALARILGLDEELIAGAYRHLK